LQTELAEEKFTITSLREVTALSKKLYVTTEKNRYS